MFSLGSKNKPGVCVYIKEANPETDRNTSVFSIFKAKLNSLEGKGTLAALGLC